MNIKKALLREANKITDQLENDMNLSDEEIKHMKDLRKYMMDIYRGYRVPVNKNNEEALKKECEELIMKKGGRKTKKNKSKKAKHVKAQHTKTHRNKKN
jgi:hypothetical protein